MIIPWQVDVPQNRYPFINWIIIVATIAIFFVSIGQISDYYQYRNKEVMQEVMNKLKKSKNSPESAIKSATEKIAKKPLENYADDFPVLNYYFNGLNLKGIFGHMWLHGDLLHLLGNMLFLWIFGNAVCAKIGNIRFFLIYIFAGLIAAIAHLIFKGGPMLGASGAINGIVGMFLVFFPQNDITCYWGWCLIYWRQFTVSSYWIILMWLVFDIFGATRGGGHTAYFAHLGGFAGGFVIAALMLKFKWIEMENYEKSLLQILFGSKEEITPVVDPRYGNFFNELNAVEQERISKNQIEQKVSEEEFFERESLPKQMDGSIRFMCPCGKRVKIPAKYAGKTGKCPKCGNKLKIPG